MTGANIFNFLSRNLDNILIGKVWGSVALGLYDRAYKLLLFPLRQVNNPIQRVMEPALAGWSTSRAAIATPICAWCG